MKNPIIWLAFFCAAVFLWQLFKLFGGLRSQAWPATSALIKRVSLEESDQGDGQMACSVHVEYDYCVDGQHYTSNRLTYSESTQLGREKALALISGFRVGLKTTAFYNPSRPAVAVLHKGIDRSSGVKTALFAALTGACLIVIFKGSV